MNRIDICKNIIQSLVGHEAYAPMPLFKTVRALLMHTAYQFTIYLICVRTILIKNRPFSLISFLCRMLYLVL